jgi:hypothetical protein
MVLLFDAEASLAMNPGIGPGEGELAQESGDW